MNVTKKDSALYAVEHRMQRWLSMEGPVRAFGTDWHPEAEIKFGSVDDVQLYVDKVLAHIGCPRPIRVRPRRGNNFAHYRMGEIAIPPRHIGGEWALRETVVLHEVAHHISIGDHQHGPDFRRAFVDLLRDAGHPTLSRMMEIALYEAGLSLA